MLVMSAAVADYSPRVAAAQKIKREQAGAMTIELVPNPDILRAAGEKKTVQVVVGFALETDNGVENAKKKLAAKHLDMVVLNNALEPGAGFGVDTNAVTIIRPGADPELLPVQPKIDIAHRILGRAAELLHRGAR